MSFRPPINRVLHSAIWCGVVGYVLTWLVHLFLKAFFRGASPFVIEGTVAAVCGGVLATLFGLYFGRTIASPVLRGFLGFVTVVLIPIVVAAAGITGMISVGYLIRLTEAWMRLRANQDHGIVDLGYSLAPLIWTAVLCWIVCWYYRARHGESLLSFDRAASPYLTPIDRRSLDQELRSVLRGVLLSGLVSWQVHRFVAGRLGWIWGSQSCVEGAMVVLSASLVAAIGDLYLSRVTAHGLVMKIFCVLMPLVVATAFGFSGYYGYQTAIFLMRLVNGNYHNETVVYGYYVFPPIWSGVFAWILGWHYKATHGGASLLNFDPPGRYDLGSPKEPSAK